MTDDLQALSHRGLTRTLIPQWLSEQRVDLDGEIESSAYGETPAVLYKKVFGLLDLGPQDRFLDLGSGAGHLVLAASQMGVASRGLERNADLVEAGQLLMERAGLPPETLLCEDFLTCAWPGATKAFAASARYSARTLKSLSQRLEADTRLTAFACLGRPLELSSPWVRVYQGIESVVWNPGEVALDEPLTVWRRALEEL